MKLFWNFLNSSSNKLYGNYLDSIYMGVAKNMSGHIELLFLVLIISFLLGVITFVTQHALRKINYYKGKDKANEKEIEERARKMSFDELKKAVAERGREFMLFYRIASIIGTILIIIYTLIFLDTLLKETTRIKLNTDFNQKLRILEPVMEDNQKKYIISKWALMEHKEDYHFIKDSINNIAQKNNIIFPDKLKN